MPYTKKSALFGTAETLFVQQHLTLEEIASQLRVHVRTLTTWKKEGEWMRKQRDYISAETTFHCRLFRFATKLMDEIEKEFDRDDTKTVSNGRLFALGKIIDKIPKTKDYEEQINRQKLGEKVDEIPKEILMHPEVRAALKAIARKVREH